MFGPRPADATEESNKVAARALGTDGVEAYQAGDYARATKQLESAYAVLRVPSLGPLVRTRTRQSREAGRSRRALPGSKPAARRRGWGRASRKLPFEMPRARDKSLLPRIPALTIRVEAATPDAATCTLDGVQLATETLGEATPVNPGTRRVACTVQGKQQKKVVTLAEGAQGDHRLYFCARSFRASRKRVRAARLPRTRALDREHPAHLGLDGHWRRNCRAGSRRRARHSRCRQDEWPQLHGHRMRRATRRTRRL